MPPTDLHFRHLLAAGLGGNISLRNVTVVDPRAQDEWLSESLLRVFREDLVEQGILQVIPATMLDLLLSNGDGRQGGSLQSLFNRGFSHPYLGAHLHY